MILEEITRLADQRRHTVAFKSKGKLAYKPVDGPANPTSDDVQGIYLNVNDDRDKSHILVFDFDDKEGKGIAAGPTMSVARHLEERGIPHVIFRSGGGHGYHIWIFFENAKRVDALKDWAKKLLSEIKEEKTKYVAVASGSLNKNVYNAKGKVTHIEHGVEVLPKGIGEQNVALPCYRESVPMRLVKEGGVATLEECSLEELKLECVPVQKPGPKKTTESSGVDKDAAFDAFVQKYDADDRAQWGAAGICLQVAFGAEDDWARDRWVEWSKTSPAYQSGDEAEWNQLSGASKYSPLSFWRIAKEKGYAGKWPFNATQTRKLLALDFLTDVKILRDQTDRAYAELSDRDFVEVNSSEFKETVALALYRRDQELPDERAVKGAQMIAAALARGTEPEEIALRFGKNGGKRYVFLADKERNIVEIDEEGWRINNNAPIQFRKGVGLPMSVERGALDELLDFLNVDADSMVFLLAWMVTAIINPAGQCPIAILDGMAGSAKSSTLSTVVQIVDPKVGALGGNPKSEEDLVVSAYSSAVLSFDNVTSLAKLSDELCRIATGGGMSKRKQYTDGDVYALDAKRPVILSGIDPTFYAQDLIERIIRVTLHKPKEYMDDDTFEIVRKEKLPRFRGALFDLVGIVLRDVHTIEQSTARFGMFTRVGESVARHLGYAPGWFAKEYEDMRLAIALESSEADSVYQFLVHHLLGCDNGVGSKVRDTAGRLLMELRDQVRESPIPIAPSDIPSNPRVMGARITACAGLLAKARGWQLSRPDGEIVFEKVREVAASADDVFEMARDYQDDADRKAGIA